MTSSFPPSSGTSEGEDAPPPDSREAVSTVEPEDGAPAPRLRKKKPTGTRALVEWVVVIGGALLVALVIRTFFLAAFYIPSESMVATLEKGDRVLVNKLSYKLHDINRGDVVVFERPPNEPDNGIKDLIKRVIALPGETIDVHDCKVFVTGTDSVQRELNEPYTDGQCTQPLNSNVVFPLTIAPHEIFVMGDNRPDSQDSRFFGPISDDLVVGRAFVIVWPLSHLGWL